jgi:hypothetical protein
MTWPQTERSLTAGTEVFRVCRCSMAQRKGTTIERIYREVTGHKMPNSVKRILLPKPRKAR